MKINIKELLLVVTTVIMFSSCKKNFLELDPQQNTDVNKTIQDINGLRAALTGTYSLLQGVNDYGRSVPLLPDLMSDNLFISVVNSNRYQSQDQYVTIVNDGNASAMWNSMYAIVANTNLIIEKGPSATVSNADTAEKRRLIGEAYAIRALTYFDLSRFFAQPYNYTNDASHLGVPIVLKTGTDKTEIQAPPRSTVKLVYDQIINDLNSAISSLSAATTTTTRTRFNLYAAQALLARVYLYKEDWQNAVNLSTAVISANKYSLLSRATFIDDFKKQNNAESVFEVANTTTDNLGTNSLSYFFSQSGYGDAIATDTLYNSYKSTDIRRGFMSRTRRTGSGGENPANIVTKYANVTSFEENIKVIRLAEIYLIRSEAYARLNQEAQARTDLNLVITRSDTDAGSVVNTSTAGNALITAILNERRKELAFEGHRLFDLTRNKISFTKIRRGGGTIAVNYPSNKTVLPIPQTELDANSNIRAQQNPGY